MLSVVFFLLALNIVLGGLFCWAYGLAVSRKALLDSAHNDMTVLRAERRCAELRLREYLEQRKEQDHRGYN